MTLVELMIGLSVSLGLSIAFIQALIVMKNIYHQQEGLAIIQENARSIHSILTELLSHQGSLGCNRLGKKAGVLFYNHPSLTGIVIKTEKWPIKKRIIAPMSDVLWVNYVKKDYAVKRISEDILQISGVPRWKAGREVVLSDCQRAGWFILKEDAKKLTQQVTQVVVEGEYVLLPSTRIAKWHSVLLYVAQTSRRSVNRQPIMALYSTDLNGRTQERVEGVERIRIEYGVKEREGVVYYSPADVPSEEDIILIRLHFLLSAPQEGVTSQWWQWEWHMPEEQF